MANVLMHYGPDRQNRLVRGGAAFIFCMHRLTPEDDFERQPLVVADRFVLLFDGRIDNRKELGDALGLNSHELLTMSDGVMVLRLFERWGNQAFQRIVGVFAVIVMDFREGALVCARDQMGLRVLHYFHSANRIAVATAPEALFALGWVPRILNEDKVADLLVQRGLNGETTYYQDIKRVLPGSFIRVHNGGVSKEEYWSAARIPEIRLKNDVDYVDAFKELLVSAVQAALRCNKVPCASITGGLDLSSIAVIAADALGKRGKKLNTFTAVPEAGCRRTDIRGRYFDETPYVRLIVELNSNIAPFFIAPSKRPLLDQFKNQIWLAGAPVGGIFNGLWTLDIMDAANAAGHNVMLSGEMGNLTMSYDGWPLCAELLRRGRLGRLLIEIALSGYRWRHMLRHQTIAPFVPLAIFRRYKHWRRGGRSPWHSFSAVRDDFAARSGIIDRAAQEYLPFDAPPPRDGRLHRISAFNSYSETADWFGRLRANFGIDVRTPAFDRRIVEFCIGIPQDQYLRNGRDRWLIRRAMQGRLPNVVLDNKRTGAQSADWFSRLTREREQIRAELKRIAENPDIASIIDIQKLNAIVDDWPDQPPPVYGSQAYPYFWALPQALGAASFIEDVIGANVGR